MENSQDTWREWSRHVLAELKRLNETQEDLNKEIKTISVEIAMLKVKSGVWGLLGGLIPVLIMVLVESIKKNG